MRVRRNCDSRFRNLASSTLARARASSSAAENGLTR